MTIGRAGSVRPQHYRMLTSGPVPVHIILAYSRHEEKDHENLKFMVFLGLCAIYADYPGGVGARMLDEVEDPPPCCSRMPAMPLKATAKCCHHIPQQKRRLTNWPAYVSLRQRGDLTGSVASLCCRSSRIEAVAWQDGDRQHKDATEPLQQAILNRLSAACQRHRHRPWGFRRRTGRSASSVTLTGFHGCAPGCQQVVAQALVSISVSLSVVSSSWPSR
jgi:hypothetical protein